MVYYYYHHHFVSMFEGRCDAKCGLYTVYTVDIFMNLYYISSIFFSRVTIFKERGIMGKKYCPFLNSAYENQSLSQGNASATHRTPCEHTVLFQLLYQLTYNDLASPMGNYSLPYTGMSVSITGRDSNVKILESKIFKVKKI